MNSMFDDLKGKVILVTGSSRGIGKATAKLLSQYQAKVILNASKSVSELENTHKEIKNSDYFVCDVSDEKRVKEMVGKILHKYRRIDGVVNNAGGGGWSSVVEGTDEDWISAFKLDVLGAVHLCRYVLPHMWKRRGGTVVNVSSAWGIPHTSRPSGASYAVAKAGLIKLTENIAHQYAPYVRANAVAPGFTETVMIKGVSREFIKKNTLLRRAADPEEIARLIVFLVSEASSYITGQVISADGGYLLKRDT